MPVIAAQSNGRLTIFRIVAANQDRHFKYRHNGQPPKTNGLDRKRFRGIGMAVVCVDLISRSFAVHRIHSHKRIIGLQRDRHA